MYVPPAPAARRSLLLAGGVLGAALVVAVVLVVAGGPSPAIGRLLGGYTRAAPSLLLLAAVVPVAIAVAARPQRGVLLLAAIVPYGGLLTIVDAPRFSEGYKEALAVYTVLWAVFSVVGKPLPKAKAPIWVAPLALYAVICVISAARVGGAQGLVGLKVGFIYTFVFLALWLCPFTRQDRDRLVTIMMVNAFVTALVGIWQQAVGGDFLVGLGYEYDVNVRTTSGWLRSFSTFSQPFPFGFFLAMVLLLGFAVSIPTSGRLRSKLFFLSSPVLLIALVFTFVRGAWLALGVGMLYLALHRSGRQRVLLLGVPLLLLGLLFLPGSFGARAFSSDSLEDRTTGWTASLNTAVSKPLEGSGIGATGASAEKALEVARVRGFFYQPDNQYFKVLYEVGVLGLWAFVMMLVFAFVWSRRAEVTVAPEDAALVTGISAHLLGIMAAGTIATYFEIFPMELFFWILLGVVASCNRESS